MRTIRNLVFAKGAWFGGLSLVTAAYILHSTSDLVSQGWAQDRGKLTSRSVTEPSGALASASAAPDFGESAKGERTEQLQREGARVVNQLVTCRGAGERLMVELPQTSVPVAALENLAAQRILQAILDDIGSEQWVINGSITEFQGRNYILLDRVTRPSKR